MKRFYCENCGAEVSEDSTICPECGAFFVAIKCPRCGYRGKAHEFRKGCPRCGYLGDAGEVTVRQVKSRIFGRRRWLFRVSPLGFGHREGYRDGTMPSWVFWIVLAVLSASFAVLAIVYARL